ncbi:hypothetical protein, partial [Moorena sp. SIO3B2]|uniref:hypothetical protein n=1 Tax=Moorena sp. SIO3B2 TaxID=2607827 RepID=UPI00257B153A
MPLAFPSWEGLGVGSSCLLPLASCLKDYVHNSNPNAITYVHQSTENQYSLSSYGNSRKAQT